MKVQLLLVFALFSIAFCVREFNNGMVVENIVETSLGPSFLAGKLGFVGELSETGAQNFISRKLNDLFHLNPSIEFIFEREETDFSGMVHYRFDQKINNIPVQYAKLILHVNPKTHEVFAISSDIVPGISLPTQPSISIVEAGDAIASIVPSPQFKLISDIELVYLNLEGKVNLVYKADIVYQNEIDEMRSFFYLDAVEGTLVAEINRYANAKKRNVYDAGNRQILPGTLVRTEGGNPTTDVDVNEAYDNSGYCYDYYYNTFGRDSYNNRGAVLDSSVHYSTNYNNAFWNGDQMVYGDGDGVNFSNFAGDLTVVCHELTHAVVEYTAGLIYQNEPGALNEGFADIFGFSSYLYQYGVDQYEWMIGPFCYTPNKPGDALRYMDNPPKDGSSYDYYPGYTGILDNGGVHWNSGIANLAYVLAVQGGTHPQKLSSINVYGIGISNAEQIFYTVLAQYLTPNSKFANARASSVTAARAAFGSTSKQAQTADDCWAAVGVPSTTV